MSCCIVLVLLIDRLRPRKRTKHQHCPKPRLYTFHLDPILIPGHSILICWMSSRKHLLILPTWVLAPTSFQVPRVIKKHPLLPIFSKTAPRSRTFVGKAPSFSDAKSKSSESPNICIFGSTIFWFFGRFTSQASARIVVDSPYGKNMDFPKRVGQVTQIWNSSWSELSHVSSENKKKTKQHRIAWWILKRLFVSCKAMQIDTHNRWVSTNCRGANRFQFMFLWHRQRSCIICSLNSMTSTKVVILVLSKTKVQRILAPWIQNNSSICMTIRLRGSSTIQKQE